ncbi:hypothetical protein GRI91_00550 [Altererythrobacter endophyticus]|uniref:Glycosyltransferase RgtA/B/C/D-like domain-containing protein n=1 Tax=Altericroceibacterium endophyticum TaxID=1808508 RepID=A0A6I4T2N7_9SPHN|nr:hypothetical protein [Altericroceibacterium endophyticum]
MTFLTRFYWFGDPVADYDEQLYSLIGSKMLEGQLPFVDLWDRKPFGLFVLFAFAHWISGPGPIAYQLLAVLFAAIGAWLIYKLAARLVDGTTALIAATLYLVMLPMYAVHSAQSEVFHVLLMIGMVCLLKTKKGHLGVFPAAGAMLLGGLALQVKYTVFPQCFFLGGYALWRFYRQGMPIKQICLMAFQFAFLGLLPTLLVFAFYLLIGQSEAYIFANFLSFFNRTPAGFWNQNVFACWFPIALLVIPGLLWARRLQDTDGLYPLVFGWFISCIITAYLSGTTYFFYFAALIPPALLLSLPMLNRKGPFGLVPALLILLILTSQSQIPTRAAPVGTEKKTIRELAAAIRPHIGKNENCLFVYDGPTALYQLTNSCLPTPIIYPDLLNNRLESRSLGIDQTEEITRILTDSPGAIVTADIPVTPHDPKSDALVSSAIDKHYRLAARGRIKHRIISAWIRKGPRTTPSARGEIARSTRDTDQHPQ